MAEEEREEGSDDDVHRGRRLVVYTPLKVGRWRQPASDGEYSKKKREVFLSHDSDWLRQLE